MNVANAFNLLFRCGLRKDFRDNFDRYAPEYPDWMKSSSMDTPELAATIITGPSRLYEMGDGEPITYEDMKVGPKVMGVDKEFGLGVAFTKRALEDDQYGKLKEGAKYLAWAARMTYEYRAASFLDDAFTGTNFKGVDGQPLFSASHAYQNGSGVQSNTMTTGLSITGVTQMTDMAMSQRDWVGDPYKVMPDTIIVSNSSGEYNKALQIFGSKLEPFTAENQDNAINKRFAGIKIVVSRFKSSRKSWFMFDSRSNDVEMRIRRPVQTEDDTDFNTGAALYKVTTRFMIWFVDFHGWFGSNPT